MTFPSSTPSPHDRDRRDDERTPRYEQLSWWSLQTTAALLLEFHKKLADVRHHREGIQQGYLSEAATAMRERWIKADVDDITAIVAELRRRGHSVDWEE